MKITNRQCLCRRHAVRSPLLHALYFFLFLLAISQATNTRAATPPAHALATNGPSGSGPSGTGPSGSYTLNVATSVNTVGGTLFQYTYAITVASITPGVQVNNIIISGIKGFVSASSDRGVLVVAGSGPSVSLAVNLPSVSALSHVGDSVVVNFLSTLPPVGSVGIVGDFNGPFGGINTGSVYIGPGTSGVSVPTATATILNAVMGSSHILVVTPNINFTGERRVTLDMTINGQPIHVSQNMAADTFYNDAPNFSVDLKAQGVPRFQDNQEFTITLSVSQDNRNDAVVDSKKMVILLPVVVVPGIGPISGTVFGDFLNDDHPAGGYGTFPGFEDYLLSHSQQQVSSIGLGQGYAEESAPYPTLYVLTYVRNVASFADGANALANVISNITAQSSIETYADKVNVVTHSKGGLVAREYLYEAGSDSNGFGLSKSKINRLIMTVPPNLGAPLTYLGKLTDNAYNYSNIYPVYPWLRRVALGNYIVTRNPELTTLNSHQLPSGVNYTLLYSRSSELLFQTLTTYTILVPSGSQFGFGDGDGAVPWFSQLGEAYDPNNPTATPPLIPAFTSISGAPLITDVQRIDGFHSSYLDSNSAAQNAIFSRLTGDVK